MNDEKNDTQEDVPETVAEDETTHLANQMRVNEILRKERDEIKTKLEVSLELNALQTSRFRQAQDANDELAKQLRDARGEILVIGTQFAPVDLPYYVDQVTRFVRDRFSKIEGFDLDEPITLGNSTDTFENIVRYQILAGFMQEAITTFQSGFLETRKARAFEDFWNAFKPAPQESDDAQGTDGI